MRKMGGLKKYLPVTYTTMLIGTLAIAGIFPLSGFFSKDEILLKAFLANKVVWTLAAITALMTAFYMFRLMSMTFFGGYRGPSWEGSGHGDGRPASRHPSAGAALGTPPEDAGPTGHGGHGAHGGHGGHTAWHGPHEAPRSMTVPLMVLAVGAVLAGLVGIPAVLGGGNAIETFLHPSFVAQPIVEHAAVEGRDARPTERAAAPDRRDAGPTEHGAGVEKPEMSHLGEVGLMAFSVFLGVLGIWVAYRFYVRRPDISERLAARFPGAHRVLSNKYYVDEIYGATFVNGTLRSADGLWAVDRHVVDGAVNGSGWATILTSWISGLIDTYIVDGLVNLVGWILERSSFVFRRAQTGLVQNYALMMLFGVFAFVTYLLLR